MLPYSDITKQENVKDLILIRLVLHIQKIPVYMYNHSNVKCLHTYGFHSFYFTSSINKNDGYQFMYGLYDSIYAIDIFIIESKINLPHSVSCKKKGQKMYCTLSDH